MSRIDQLLAAAAKQTCEAVVLASMRQVQLLVSGTLRPFSNRPLGTPEILGLLGEIAPPDRRAELEADCELKFAYQGEGLPGASVSVDRKGDYVFARIELAKRPAVAMPPNPRPPQAAAAPSSPPRLARAEAPAPPAKPAAPGAPEALAAVAAPKVDFPADLPRPLVGLPFDPLAAFPDMQLDALAASPPASQPPPSPPTAKVPDEPLELDTSRASSNFAASFTGTSIDFGTARDFEAPAGDAPLELDPQPRPMLAGPFGSTLLPPRPAPPPAQPKPPAVSFAPVEPVEPTSPAQGELRALLKDLLARGGSDLHVAAGSPPRMRVCGELVATSDQNLSPQLTEAMFEAVLSPEQRERFQVEKSLDFSLDLPGVGRFRANTYRQRKGIDLVFRAIAPRIPTLADLGLPEAATRLTEFPNGLILVTGPAGCGKSTTQAAIVDRINETWRDHIITVEDPIEFVHPAKNCLVNQREVGTHVRSFAEALRSALREDPDVILVGELRDLETIQLAITAAETGHLVLGTLHTVDSARTIDRLVDVFPGEQKLQMRSMVSESLRGVISQRLLPAADGHGRVAAFELLLVDRSVSNLIREGKTFQIPNVLRMGRGRGMCAMDDSIIQLVQARKVSREVAIAHMDKPEELEKALAAARERRGQPPGAGRPAGAPARKG